MLRSSFHLPDGIELRAFTHGLMPKTVPAMMRAFTEDWRRLGVDAWNEVPNHWLPRSGERVGWWSLPTYLGDRFIAPLLGAPERTCIMQPNVHATVSFLFSSPEVFAHRKEVVVTEAEFPSVLHTAHQWKEMLGLRVHAVPPGADGFVDRAAVMEQIGARTALVVLSHVGFTTGEVLPDSFLQEVAREVHRHGGLLAIDGYHATGSLPVDVEALEADVYFGGLLKEACGSSGNAYVYVRPGLELTPRLAGWFGGADPFAFAPEPRPHPEVRRRFLGGTTAVASLYHAVEGVRLLLDAGLDAVRADSRRKTQRCIERAEAASLPLRSPREEEKRGAMVILEVEAADRLSGWLKERNIYTDSRKDRYLRMAPFVWNTSAEIDRAFDAIEDAVATGDYKTAPVDPPRGPVT